MWTGVPLFLCIGKVDGGKGHGGYGAYNEALALRGYRIRLFNASGRYVTIGSRLIMNRSRIILANKVDGKELTSAYPLRLVGPRLTHVAVDRPHQQDQAAAPSLEDPGLRDGRCGGRAAPEGAARPEPL